MKTETVQPSRWGRARFGGSSALLICASILGALLLSTALGLLVWQFSSSDDPQRNALAGTGFAVVMLPATFALCWVIMLDRDTLAGAVKDPDSSIEGRWLEKAGFGTLGDVVAVAGLGSAALAIFKIDISASNAMVTVVALAFVDIAIRYLLLKKVEG